MFFKKKPGLRSFEKNEQCGKTVRRTKGGIGWGVPKETLRLHKGEGPTGGKKIAEGLGKKEKKGEEGQKEGKLLENVTWWEAQTVEKKVGQKGTNGDPPGGGAFKMGSGGWKRQMMQQKR